MTKIKKILLVIGAATIGAWPLLSKAGVQEGLAGISGYFPSFFGVGTSETVGQVIGSVIDLLLLFAGALAVLFIIIGGYWYIASAGNEEMSEKGKKTLINAIIGVVIIVLSYVIINAIVNTITTGGIFG